MCVLAVRKSLGLYPSRKVTTLEIPTFCQDAVLLKDLFPFVEKSEQCGRHSLHRAPGDWSPVESDSTVSEDDFIFSSDSEPDSSEEEEN